MILRNFYLHKLLTFQVKKIMIVCLIGPLQSNKLRCKIVLDLSRNRNDSDPDKKLQTAATSGGSCCLTLLPGNNSKKQKTKNPTALLFCVCVRFSVRRLVLCILQSSFAV